MDRGRPIERTPFTVDDLFDLPNDGKRYEIYDGEVFMVPPPLLSHQHASRELSFSLHHWVRSRGLGEIYFAPVALVLDATNYVEPDLIYVSREREAILTERGVEGVPDLVVEILSPSTRKRDLAIKRDLYARFGVANYWLVDPASCEIVALELDTDAGDYREVVRTRETFEPRLFAGLTIDVASLFRRFDAPR